MSDEDKKIEVERALALEELEKLDVEDDEKLRLKALLELQFGSMSQAFADLSKYAGACGASKEQCATLETMGANLNFRSLCRCAGGSKRYVFLHGSITCLFC
ncbi:MAG: hypothetical protein AAF704_14765 [Cyanobacteria bacterium P01_D01_bin.123]